MATRQLSKTVAALTITCALQLAAGPANATKDFSDKGVLPGPVDSLTPFLTSHSVDANVSDEPKVRSNGPPTKRKIVAAPEPAGWLMMLLGFGLLGVAARGGAPDPFPAQRELRVPLA